MDSIIISILGELYHIYNKLIISSNDIQFVFEPVLKALNCNEKVNIKCNNLQILFENIHKQEFEEVFINDDFIKVTKIFYYRMCLISLKLTQVSTIIAI